jgi:MFS transporter, DHA1 family, multidrug resistance protein
MSAASAPRLEVPRQAAPRQRAGNRWLALVRPPALLSWERTAWIAAATQFVTMIGFGLSMPFIPLYVQALGIHDRAEVALWSGVLAGSAALSLAFMAPIWGALSDRYGRKPMLVRSMIGGAVVIAAMGYVGDVWQLFGLRLIQGSVSGSQAAAAALVAGVVPASQAGFALGLIATAVQVGNTFGPAVGGLTVDALGFRGSFLVGGATLLIGGLMAVFWIDEPANVRARSRQMSSGTSILERTLGAFLWPSFRNLLILQGGTQFAFSAAVSLLPIYLQDMQRPDWLSPELASGLAITATAVTAALSMPFLGRWTDRRGPRGLLIASLGGSALVLVVQALVPTVGLFLALRGVLGIWLAGVTATLSVLTKLQAPSGREGTAFGAASSVQGLGWGIGPILGSVLVALGGIPLLYLMCGLVMAALVWPAVNARSRPSRPVAGAG